MLVGDGIPVERGRQRGVYPLKRRYFAAVGSSVVKTVADTACGQKCVIMAAAQTLDSFFAS